MKASKTHARWLSVRELAAKYGMDRKTVRSWIAGHGKHVYRLTVIKTPAGMRILDPQLELPPHRTAPVEELFIFRASEVAALLGATKRAVNFMAERGQIRFAVYDGKRFFPLSEVRRLLSTRGSPRRGLRHAQTSGGKTSGMVSWARQKLSEFGQDN